jgi:hypothetical protein
MADVQTKRRSSVALSRKDLATTEGLALLAVLERIMTDGCLTDQEIKELATWLEQTASTSTLPGLQFLREEVAGMLADGNVSEAECRLLRNAILRVLPVTERERVKAKIAEATARERAREREERTAAAYRVTQKQLEYIRDLGGDCNETMTKQQASEIIDQLLESRPTVRQRMVLRFWNRQDLLKSGVEGVSAWMDRWYEEDPHRLEAWELWKRESGDTGDRSLVSVESVPLGAGQEYLARVKAARRDWSLGLAIVACLILLVVALIFLS